MKFCESNQTDSGVGRDSHHSTLRGCLPRLPLPLAQILVTSVELIGSCVSRESPRASISFPQRPDHLDKVYHAVKTVQIKVIKPANVAKIRPTEL